MESVGLTAGTIRNWEFQIREEQYQQLCDTSNRALRRQEFVKSHPEFEGKPPKEIDSAIQARHKAKPVGAVIPLLPHEQMIERLKAIAPKGVTVTQRYDKTLRIEVTIDNDEKMARDVLVAVKNVLTNEAEGL